mgnify:FL=1
MWTVAVDCTTCTQRTIVEVGLEQVMRWRENGNPDELANLPADTQHLLLTNTCPKHDHYPELDDY